ncbi:HAD family hydrolase [Cryobacterium frigoriphilum]|uniref:HAD family hydrolase n=1 Tax=Cryobacterium frigoriphilum TaxID=1259150 RepID=A0A4R8ZZZ6_9MICO|nr:HAD hydrolase-like protein [Cryobacterium frigoriphilum]TFD49641.1 HAD family hydrolase [Cryobacterium frigoriphilum]
MTQSRPASHILFDLDGTLVQTRVASWQVFQQVNDEFGLGIDTKEQYFDLLNGNLFEQIRELCDSTQRADAAIESFMSRLGSDYFPVMIPGMVDVVHALAPTSVLAVLTSNLTSVIRRVLIGNGIEYCFAHVFGGDVEPNKTHGIRRFIADAAQGTGRRCSAFYDEDAPGIPLGDDQTVLVTDTIGDVEAALAAGIRAVGVSWGMHTEDQLTAAGAEFVAFWPQELVSYLRNGDSSTSCAVAEVAQTAAPDVTDPGAVSAAIRRARRHAVVTGAAAAVTHRLTSAVPPAAAAGCGCGCAKTGVQTDSPAPAPAQAQAPRSRQTHDDLFDAVQSILGHR